ncbi:hypothetical protein JN531_012895 [Flagellatimonas centrodinii]|uniref:hypothetical protein n=1 Tax=Flagellatimonas centrodinii TaxID=2806210 RepID=UPI001FEE6E75|nr:hypothetical protein [Flagellatimonas centrodinii]ULQ45994.1 hypothetical protein JN531_012895 [Flagellatimonas centrodinii]
MISVSLKIKALLIISSLLFMNAAGAQAQSGQEASKVINYGDSDHTQKASPSQASMVKITLDLVGSFLNRTSATVFAPHGLNILEGEFFFEKGVKTENGLCKFSESYPISHEELAKVNDGYVISTVQIAVDHEKCESIIERGFIRPEERRAVGVPEETSGNLNKNRLLNGVGKMLSGGNS